MDVLKRATTEKGEQDLTRKNDGPSVGKRQ